MRARGLFFSLMLLMLTIAAGCPDYNLPAEPCTSVDGVPCRRAIALGQVSSSCQQSDHCIVEAGVSCICDGSGWVCGDPPLRHQMAVQLPPANDAATVD
jgi:hypothetical protein